MYNPHLCIHTCTVTISSPGKFIKCVFSCTSLGTEAEIFICVWAIRWGSGNVLSQLCCIHFCLKICVLITWPRPESLEERAGWVIIPQAPCFFRAPLPCCNIYFKTLKQTYPFFINEEAPNKANTTDAAQSLICCVFSFLSGHCLMLWNRSFHVKRPASACWPRPWKNSDRHVYIRCESMLPMCAVAYRVKLPSCSAWPPFILSTIVSPFSRCKNIFD